MLINNNTPSFGMAFRPPKIHDTKPFALLLNKTAKDADLAERGFQKFIRQQSKNNNYDVRFDRLDGKSFFSVISNKTEKVITSYPSDSSKPSKFEMAVRCLLNSVKDIRTEKKDGNISAVQVLTSTGKSMFKFMRSGIESEFDSLEALPAGMRAAGERANALELHLKRKSTK